MGIVIALQRGVTGVGQWVRISGHLSGVMGSILAKGKLLFSLRVNNYTIPTTMAMYTLNTAVEANFDFNSTLDIAKI